MKLSSLSFVAIGLLYASAGSAAQSASTIPALSGKPVSINKSAAKNQQLTTVTGPAAALADSNADSQMYIVQFDDLPVARQPGLRNASPRSVSATRKGRSMPRLNPQHASVQAYQQQLEQTQLQQVDDITRLVGKIEVVSRYQYALNGMAIKATPAQISHIRHMSGVQQVHLDYKRKLNTDTGPILIGAQPVWEGQLDNGAAANLGEGITIAVLDTGINTDHRSFADVGDDGYDHTNPLGSGVYLGDCAQQYPDLCNDKLIGVVSYPDITNAYSDAEVFTPELAPTGEDYNGHGSHVAATAAGNVLYEVKEVFPDGGAQASDGIESGFVYSRISGVAPHANLVSYQVCLPGETDDTYNGCYDSAIVKAIDDAVASGVVDIINFSVSGGGDPWSGAVNTAWLNAHEAGVFSSHSASNDGPATYTTDKHAPWLTVVGASSHGRLIDYSKQLTNFEGGLTPLSPITGSSNTAALSGAIVYAGDYANANNPGADPAQCLEPYPAGTFDGQIVVCDRGDIARIQKAKNVQAGGAAGFVLANVADGADNLANDTYVIPGIHITAADASRLRDWLALGSGHSATITAATGGITIDDDQADIMADFSSRGPNSSVSTLTPHLTAPGVDVYAAFSDEHYGHDETGPAPADFAYLSGTSMASPHVAGAAALVANAHPDWSVDEIRSALMMTANTAVTTDGQTPADWFAMGAGRVQVDDAIRASLVMHETTARYTAANPDLGGEPRALNMPAVVDANCFTTCTWTRTVTATQSGTWSAQTQSLTEAFELTVVPASFTLSEGQTQQLTITMNAAALQNNVWGYGTVRLITDNSPELHIPVVGFASNGTVPDTVNIEAHRNYDSYVLKDIFTVDIEDFAATAYGLVASTKVEDRLAADSNNSSLFDDSADGIYTHTVVVNEQDIRLVAEVTNASSPDIDLYLARDDNGNGVPEESELVAQSTAFDSNEYISLEYPVAGTYFILVQNYAGSGAQADDFTLHYAVVDNTPSDNFSVEGPAQAAAMAEFDLRLFWQLPDAQRDERYYGAFELGSNSDNPNNIGLTQVDLVREQDDVYLSSPAPGRYSVGDVVDFAVNVITNETSEDRRYAISAVLPDTLQLDADSVGSGGEVTGNTISWDILQPSVQQPDALFAVSQAQNDNQCALTASSIAQSSAKAYTFDTATDYASFAVNMRYLDQPVSQLTVARNGFVSFADELTADARLAAQLPSPALPNAVVAPLWAQLDSDEMTSVSVQQGTDAILITWQDLLDANNNRVSMQLWLAQLSESSASAGSRAIQQQSAQATPTLVVRYLTVADNTHGVAGFEDFEGKRGMGFSLADYGVSEGSAVCYYPLNAEIQVVADLGFSAQIKAGAPVGPFAINVTSQVTNIEGTESETAALYSGVQVEGSPEVTINGRKQAAVSVSGRQTQTLSAEASDPNNDTLRFVWSVPQNSALTLSNSTSSTVSFTTPLVTSQTQYTLTVTVTDNYGNSDSAEAVITVSPEQTVANSSSSSSSGGGALVWVFLLLPIALWRRLKRQR